MIRRFTLADIATALSVAILAAAAIAVAIKGPAGPIPMHFDIQGNPDRWGDRTELAITLGGMALLAGLLGGGMGWYAARTDDPARARGLRLGQWITAPVIGFVGLLVGWTALSGAGGATDIAPMTGWMMAGLALVYAAIGAVIGRMPPNVVAGVRTPWTFKSRLAWDKSNRLAGRLFFWIGVISLLAAPLAAQPAGLTAQTVAIILGALWAVIESWRVWRTDPDRQPF